jgi:hypothetical protein
MANQMHQVRIAEIAARKASEKVRVVDFASEKAFD